MQPKGKRINRRTYWVFPDEKGKPAESPQSTGRPGETQWQEDLYEDGTTVLSRWDAGAKDWEQVDVKIDEARAKQWETDNPAAPKPKGPERVPTETNEPWIVYSDGSKVQNPNFKPPVEKPEPTVERPAAPGERVTVTQANFDRQAAQDALTAAQQKEATVRADLATKIASERWTADQAKAVYDKEMEAIRLDLQKQQHAASLATQQRGQDLQAQTSRENAALAYQTDLVDAAVSTNNAMLPHTASDSEWARLDSAVGDTARAAGMSPLAPAQRRPVPDPMALVLQAAQAARNFSMPMGTPQPQPVSPYSLPMR